MERRYHLNPGSWKAGKKRPRSAVFCAEASWLLVASFVLMVGTFMATGLPTPAQAPKVLPAGVIGLVGYANRLLVLSYYVWVIVVARSHRGWLAKHSRPSDPTMFASARQRGLRRVGPAKTPP